MIKMYVSMRYKKYFCMINGDKLVEIQKGNIFLIQK